MKKKKYYVFIPVLLVLYSFFFIAGSYQTHAWFVSEVQANGEITNATTNDLLAITISEIVYEKNCEISFGIEMINISDLEIPLQFLDVQKQLLPGESINTPVTQTISCEQSEVNVQLIGWSGYIDEMIQVPLNKDSLLATIEKVEKECKKEVEETRELEEGDKEIPEMGDQTESIDKEIDKEIVDEENNSHLNDSSGEIPNQENENNDEGGRKANEACGKMDSV